MRWWIVLVVFALAGCSGSPTTRAMARDPLLEEVLADSELSDSTDRAAIDPCFSIRCAGTLVSRTWEVQQSAEDAARAYNSAALDSGWELVRTRCSDVTNFELEIFLLYQKADEDWQGEVRVFPTLGDDGEYSAINVRADLTEREMDWDVVAIGDDLDCVDRHLELLEASGAVPQLSWQELATLLDGFTLRDGSAPSPQAQNLDSNQVFFDDINGGRVRVESASPFQNYQWFGFDRIGPHEMPSGGAAGWWVGYDGGALIVELSGANHIYAEAISRHLNGE